jgi:hypothetical protein
VIPIKIEKPAAGRDKLRAARRVRRSEGENLVAEFSGTDAGSLKLSSVMNKPGTEERT